MARLKLSQVPSRIRARDIKVGDTVFLRRGKGPNYDLDAIDVNAVKHENMTVVHGKSGPTGQVLNYWPNELVIGIAR